MARKIAFVVLVVVMSIVVLAGLGLFSTKHTMDACHRVESAGTCGPICLQEWGADEVGETLRTEACEHAAADLEEDGDLDAAIAQLETCRGFGGCEDALDAVRCRADHAACEARCDDEGAVSACWALLPFDAERGGARGIELVRRFCELDPGRCRSGARRFCVRGAPCGQACMAEDNTLPELCQAAAGQAAESARMQRRSAAFADEEEEAEGTIQRARASAARLEEDVARYRAAACRLTPSCSNP